MDGARLTDAPTISPRGGPLALAGAALLAELADERPAPAPAPPRCRPALLGYTLAPEGHTPAEHRRAAALVAEHAADSLDPFALREDKRFHFAHGGVLGYRTIRETAVVGGDPIGPAGSAPAILESFMRHAHARGWGVALTGASSRHLDHYRRFGLRTLQIGNEALVDPRAFTLEGRSVRKVRQSVARVARRGWTLQVLGAGELSETLIGELDAVEQRWRADQPRLVGFAMTLGRLWGAEEDAHNVYVLGRDPEGELRSFLHFVRYGDGLSLDTMRRAGDGPNGLNEALVVAALEHAREHGVAEVSLNFAGFAHLMAPKAALSARQRVARCGLRCVHGRFQLERLVRFNAKFSPAWHPRYLVYGARCELPLAALRVLQVEGYVRPPAPRGVTAAWRPGPRPVTRPVTIVRPPAIR